MIQSTIAAMRSTSLILLGLLLGAQVAHAQTEQTDTQTPSADLYLRRRPPTGASIDIPEDLKPRLAAKEKEAAARRTEAIHMLEEFLATNPDGEAGSEAIFKLAELYWEEARRQYVTDQGKFDQETEACRQRSETCASPPKQPKLDLTKSEKLYRRMVNEFPRWRRIDLVIYLLGFAAREDGRTDEAIALFYQVIDEHADSPLYTDSWMMVGEYWFGDKSDFGKARDAYAKVLEHPDSPVYDLALFKSAWCDWKLGDPQRAAKRFKEVLDLAAAAEKSGNEKERRRRAQLRDEALDYLIVVFTEDESVTAKDVYDFLASIGGERYSREVLGKLAEVFFAESRYDRAVQAYQYLIVLDPLHPDAPKYQIQVVESFMALDDQDKALTEAKRLADDYNEKSEWAKANKDRPEAVKRAAAAAEETLRIIGKRMHEDAQRDEKAKKKANVAMYGRAADVYAYYLGRFDKDTHAVEIRFLRAEILFFKLGKYEEAGDEYLAVGKTAPVGPYHKDALLKAMAAFEKARPANVTGKHELTAADHKFAEATDLYATLFPADPQIVTVIFKNGQMFYDYGDYDEAVKRFGLIVTKYPDDPNAGAAGDRILEALAKGEDYENVETWARKLKDAKAFKSAAEQERLDHIIVDAINKSGDKNAETGHFEQAAGFYMRVAKEYPDDKRAPTALFNAGVVLEKAKQPEQAADAYLLVVKRYPKAKEAPKSAFTAGQVYEQMAYFDKAAEAYALCADKFPDDVNAADALFNAGVLSQAGGKPKDAIKHYEAYAKRYADRKDSEDVSFRVGVVYEESGDYGRAAQAYEGYVTRYGRKGTHLVEAHMRTGRAFLKLGKEKQASEQLAEAVKTWKGLSKGDQKGLAKYAAEARYLQGELIFKDYQRVSLDVKPAKLKATLDKKSQLLVAAQKIFVEVVEYGDATWGTAALYRIGQMYEGFADELRNAPTPNGLTQEEQQVYREELDKYVVDIEDKALDAYKLGYQKALELRVYNQYTKLLREGLGRLAGSAFPPEREARVKSRIGDRPPTPPILKDVVRDE